MARPPKSMTIERLQRALDTIPQLKKVANDSPELTKWRKDTQVTITRAFGDRSRHIQDFDKLCHWPPLTSDQLYAEYRNIYLRDLELVKAALESMLKEIEEYWEDEHQTPLSSATQEKQRTNTNGVFVIHGRDEGTRAIVARFLEQLNLKPVILDEQSNQGLTIIEKFERHAQVGFAVALLTPDDAGAFQGDGSNLNPRARQNVIFELGFFIGKLGREGVCVLTKGTVEIPSDYAGVVCIPLDDGGWKMDLIGELKKVGFDVDANKAL